MKGKKNDRRNRFRKGGPEVERKEVGQCFRSRQRGNVCKHSDLERGSKGYHTKMLMFLRFVMSVKAAI